MKKHFLFSALAMSCAAFAASTLTASSARADVKLNPIFSDNMVVQRGLPIPLYGTARPGEAVRVLAGLRAARTVADKDGNWQAKLPSRAVGPAFEITVQGDNKITLHNVVAGDVWLCGGQSNMEFGMWGTNNSAAEIASAAQPMIRLFSTPREMADTPRNEVSSGRWEVSSPQTIPGFSAVGYFFGRELNQKTGVPIGLINTNWGGTVAEAWTSRAALQADAQLRPLLERFTPSSNDSVAAQKEYEAKLAAWQAGSYLPYAEPLPKTQNWKNADFDDSQWKTISAPGVWELAGLNIDGAVWLRREIDVPASLAGRDLKLNLGPIDDFDTTYFNGEKVGGLGPQENASWTTPREYSLPGRLVKAGRNVIAVRVFDRWGGGGFAGTPAQMSLARTDSTQGNGYITNAISLAGAWRYAIEFARDQSALAASPVAPEAADSPNRPTVLFNSKIAPLLRSPIRGAIWYQGESNAGRAYQYRALLPAMIRDWRNHWKATGSGNFPFYIVELANFQPRLAQPNDDAWAELREAQQMTARNVPSSGIASAIDIGDAADIHPKNKQDVGHRLALIALAKNYGLSNLEYSGPQFSSMKIEGDTIRLNFSHAAGLQLKGDEPSFSIAGADRKFVWAQARLDGQSVVLSSPLVKNPAAARYAWASNPATPLYNAAQLPALPFRTDNWPGITVNNK